MPHEIVLQLGHAHKADTSQYSLKGLQVLKCKSMYIFCRIMFYRLVRSSLREIQLLFKRCPVITPASTFALLIMKWVTLLGLKLTSKFCVSSYTFLKFVLNKSFLYPIFKCKETEIKVLLKTDSNF